MERLFIYLLALGVIAIGFLIVYIEPNILRGKTYTSYKFDARIGKEENEPDSY